MAAPSKWNALQHLEHIHLGVKAMANYFEMPKPVIEEKFGRLYRTARFQQSIAICYICVGGVRLYFRI